MALIRQSLANTVARDAVVLDLGDLVRQGEALKAKARAEADRIVAEAKAERARLVAGAAEEGRKEGLARGLEEGRRQGEASGRAEALAAAAEALKKLDARWSAALAEFEGARETMLLGARQDVLRLALAAAEMVTKRAIALRPEAAADQLAAVLGLIMRPTRLTVSVHPDDAALVREALPGLTERFAAAAHAEVAADAGLERGSCVARTGTGGVIDASVRTQLERIVEALLPGVRAVDEAGGEAGAAS
jgi:flagellar biosynthesis/type III secretory pathway protein FliH